MKFIEKLEYKFNKSFSSSVTQILIGGQLLSFLLIYSRRDFTSYFFLNGKDLISGQFWKIFILPFAPISENMIFFALALYFFYIIGSALEVRWGAFRYLLYIILGLLSIYIFAIFFPDISISNTYLYTSLFLAFAHLFPGFQVLVLFIIPLKVKWLGYFTWFLLLLSVLSGSIPEKILTLSSVLNYIIFFYSDLKNVFRRDAPLRYKSKQTVKQKPFHVCAVCGKNEIDNPKMEIRYCNHCFPSTCYCGEHILHHQHKRSVN